MQGWLDVWRLPGHEPRTSDGLDGHADGRPDARHGFSRGDKPPPRSASPEEMNEQFLRFMIPHHAAAVPMSQAVLDRSDNTVVSTFARKVISAQRAEIQVMQDHAPR